MKRLLLFIPLLFIIVACGSKDTLIHDDFKSDLEQILDNLDLAYEENRELTESEENLHNKFKDKYIMGHFRTNGKSYKMNDLEKEITREVIMMKTFTEHDETLSSEKTLYEQMKDEIDKYLNLKEIPNDLIGKYPTYEEQHDVHSQFMKDTKEMIETLDPVINVRDEIYQREYDMLQEYLDLYGGEGFEAEGTHYLHNEDTDDMYMVFWSINYDLDDGVITGRSQERFNELKNELN